MMPTRTDITKHAVIKDRGSIGGTRAFFVYCGMRHTVLYNRMLFGILNIVQYEGGSVILSKKEKSDQLKIKLYEVRVMHEIPMSYQYLADHFDLSPSYVSDIINGHETGEKALMWFKRFENYVNELMII